MTTSWDDMKNGRFPLDEKERRYILAMDRARERTEGQAIVQLFLVAPVVLAILVVGFCLLVKWTTGFDLFPYVNYIGGIG